MEETLQSAVSSPIIVTHNSEVLVFDSNEVFGFQRDQDWVVSWS